MQRLSVSSVIVVLVVAGLALAPARAAAAKLPPNITVSAEGKVMAVPDVARLTLEVETQAATAAAAAQQNARRADGVLKALKKVLKPEDQIKTLGYRLFPVRNYKSKTRPPEIKAYRAVNRLEVKVMDVARLATVIDTGLQNGVSQVKGPYWSHSRLEELQQQAAVNALERARRLADALAKTAGVKIKGVEQVSTGMRLISPRPLRENYMMAKAASPAATPTPIEVGEEEIRANVQAIFLISP